MNHEVYYLPVSFIDAGRVFGLFGICNLVEAALLTPPLLYFCMALLPLSLTSKLTTTVILVVPVGGFALIGINGDSLTWRLGCWWRWRRVRRTILLRGEAEK